MNHQPRETLRELIVEYGRSLCDDPRRCEALLKDHCGQYKREIFLLVTALKGGVAAEVLKAPANVPPSLVLARVQQRLADETAISPEAAHWAVESWALALGVIAGPVSVTANPSPGIAQSAPTRPSRAAKKRTESKRLSPTPTPPSDTTAPLLGGRYRDHGDGTVTDVQTGLQWMRFSLGQSWKDGTCVGAAEKHTWKSASCASESINEQHGYAGFNDWRLPTKSELLTLVYQNKKELGIFWKAFKALGGFWKRGKNEYRDNRESTIFTLAFPNTPPLFWSSSVEGEPWSVSFQDGLSIRFPPEAGCAVRLVRSIKPTYQNPLPIKQPAPRRDPSSTFTSPSQSRKSKSQNQIPVKNNAIKNSPSSTFTLPNQSKSRSTPQNSTPINQNVVSLPPLNTSENLINGRYQIHDNGTVTDISTGLQWMRFSLGQQWIKGIITGEAEKYNFKDAQDVANDFNLKGGYAEHADWYLPTREELLTLVYCESKEINIWNKSGKGCPRGCRKPTINNQAFPNSAMYFWSSSKHEVFYGFAWVVFFDTGKAWLSSCGADGAVRLARKTQI